MISASEIQNAQEADAVPRVIIVAVVLGSILFVIIKLMVITCCIKQRKENRSKKTIRRKDLYQNTSLPTRL